MNHPQTKTSRRDFIMTLGAAAYVAQGAVWATSKNMTNVVLINIDDLGWTDLTCFGSGYYETPNLDRLASQGMKFTNAYAACAVCSPTRAAIMTGRYPAATGVTDWIRARFQRGPSPERSENPIEYVGGKDKKVLCPPNPFWLELEEVTIAEVLKEVGYTTCHIGKWHLGDEPQYPEFQGFDFNYGGCDYGQPPSYFDPYANPKLPEGIPTLEPRREGEYLTDREADEAVGFIRRHRDKPFFLYLANYAVHTPIQAKQSVADKYRAKTATNQKDPKYAAMVESVDDCVGKVMDVLNELGLEEQTLVIFTSDNGGLLGPTHNAPLREGKGHPYEGGIRIPQIVRWPGVVEPGSECDVPVISVDFFPTICEAVGTDLPAGRLIHGRSLVPVLKGNKTLNRDAIFWHFPHYRGNIFPYSIIRSGEWKLIKRYDGKEFELFNLKDDLGETRDLAEQEPAIVNRLDRLLTAFLKQSRAKLPRSNPDYEPRQ